ncbi:MAG: hypothetical protein JW871_00310 [Endomicrobiales bacterium]|nr:hypothetical protein [Endomicrobiales bacterium]
MMNNIIKHTILFFVFLLIFVNKIYGVPHGISNLTALTLTNPQWVINLQWTVPDPCDASDTPTDYVVNYATSEVTSSNIYDAWVSTYTHNWSITVTSGNPTSQNVTGLTPGVTYFFAIRASDGSEYGVWNSSSETSGAVNTANFAYSWVDVGVPVWDYSNFEVHTTSVVWAWELASNATGYRVITSSDNSNISGNLADNVTYFYQTGLTPNTTYSVYIQAFNGTLSSNSSMEISSFTYPNPPSDITTSSRTTRSIALEWSDNSNPSYTRYTVQYSTDNWVTFPVIMRLADSTTHLHSVLMEGVTYSYKIWATNNDGIPLDANATKVLFSTVTTKVDPGAPSLTAAQSGTNDGEVSLTWTAPYNDLGDSNSGKCSSYLIKWATYTVTSGDFNIVSNNKTVAATSEPGLSQFATLTGLCPGTTYSFALKAVDSANNYSAMSIALSTTSRDNKPSPPTSVNAVATSSFTIYVSWSPSSVSGYDDRDKYKIYRATFPFSGLITNVSTFTMTVNHQLVGATTGYNDVDLDAETTHYYRVSCLDKGDQDEYKSTALESLLSATTGIAYTPDTTSPSAITTLSAATGTNEGEIKLTWTAPGDDGEADKDINSGKFCIDWTDDVLDVPNLSTSTCEVSISTSTSLGEAHTYLVTGLTEEVTYYFRIWTADESANWSDISTGATDWAQIDLEAPGEITELSAQAQWKRVTLTWTAPGDDVYVKNISSGQFKIVFSTLQAMAPEYTDSPVQLSTATSLGESHTYTLTGLTNELTYYFNIYTADERENWSLVSVSTPQACPTNSYPTGFSLTNPADKSITNGKPTFEWSESTDSDTTFGDILIYYIYFSTDSSFSLNVTTVVPKGSADRSHTPTFFLIENATYYWKVSVSDSDNAVVWASTRTIRINSNNTAPSSFDLLAPLGSSITPTATPTLSWQTSIDEDPGDSVTYRVDISSYLSFAFYNSSAWISETSYVASGLEENLRYFWRVWATDSSSTTLSNSSTDFYVNATPEPPDTFNITSPATETEFSTTYVEFIWEPTTDPDPTKSGNVTYNFVYSYFSDFASSTTISGLMYNATSFSLPHDNRQYYWGVDAVGPDGMVRRSNQRSMLYTDLEKELPQEFELTEPAYGITISTTLKPWFFWEPSSDPDPADTIRYYIDVSIDPNFEGSQAIPTGTDTFYQPVDDLIDQATYYWRVRASGYQGTPPNRVDSGFVYSSTWVFRLSMVNNHPQSFNLVSPANGSSVETKIPSFSWNVAVDNDFNESVTYNILVSSVSDFSVIYKTSSSIVSTSYTSDTEFQENRTYYWKVIACDRKGLETISNNTFSFTIPVLTKPLPPVGLNGVLSPDENSFTISWSDVVKNSDGSIIDDLLGYKIYRAVSLTAFDYNNPVALVSSDTNEWTDSTIQGGNFYYLIRTIDSSGIESDNSMILESLEPGKLNVRSSDGDVLVIISASASKYFLKENNKWQKNLTLNIERNLDSELDNILRVYELKVVDAELNEISGYEFSPPLTMEYNYSEIEQSISKRAPSIIFNAERLSVYWHNGVEYIRTGGHVDDSKRRFVAMVAKTGKFQLRQTTKAPAFGLASLNPKKVFTPGVAPYEKMTFNIDNPTGDKVTGKIFNLKGEYITDLTPVGDATNTTVILEWDGQDARKGVYIYQIEGDGQVVNGTIILAK